MGPARYINAGPPLSAWLPVPRNTAPRLPRLRKRFALTDKHAKREYIRPVAAINEFWHSPSLSKNQHCQMPMDFVSNSIWPTDNRTNGQPARGVNPVFTRLHASLNPRRMTPFLFRPNKSAQLLNIIVALAKLTDSSSDVNSWHIDKLNQRTLRSDEHQRTNTTNIINKRTVQMEFDT